jgi:hypothetical protein
MRPPRNPAEESGRCRGLAAAPGTRQTGEGGPNVRLPIPIAAFGPQGRFSQLSARSGPLALPKAAPITRRKFDHLGQFAGKALAIGAAPW